MNPPPVYCVFGKPIGHSLSPVLHARLLDAEGLPGTYVAVEEGDAAAAVRTFRERGIAGASVTLPLKVRMLDAVDERDPSAEAAGGVNTLHWRDGRVVGANTDLAGVRASLDRLGFAAAGRVALVLGTGGAARVAARILVERGVGELIVGSRDVSRAESFVRVLGAGRGLRWPDGASGAHVDLLVNATPVGMWPAVDESPVPADRLDRIGAVLDLVYNPDPTKLVREASARGLPALGGVEMFVVQAARQFAIWTGKEPDLAAVRDIVRKLLEADR